MPPVSSDAVPVAISGLPCSNDHAFGYYIILIARADRRPSPSPCPRTVSAAPAHYIIETHIILYQIYHYLFVRSRNRRVLASYPLLACADARARPAPTSQDGATGSDLKQHNAAQRNNSGLYYTISYYIILYYIILYYIIKYYKILNYYVL